MFNLIRIGMLHHRRDPSKVIKSYAYAAVAKAEGAELVYFSPRRVRFEDSVIHGWVLEDGEWVERVTPFPDVIYNAGSPIKLSKSKAIIDKLKETIPFTTHSIGNKEQVYERLKKAKTFSRYLIPSKVLKNGDIHSFFQFIHSYKSVVFKPVNGRKGQGILLIEQTGTEFRVLKGTESTQMTYEELRDLLIRKMSKKNYMVQPYIRCKTKNGQSYDFRLHVQKNGEGKWVITSIYPRIAASGTFISNINNGGSVNYLEPFLKQEFDEEYDNIKRYLEMFSLQLAHHMDDIQIRTFNEEIDELGIDVGLDEQGKLWIYEVNWRPGCPPTFYLEMDVVKNMIQYCLYLSDKHQNG